MKILKVITALEFKTTLYPIKREKIHKITIYFDDNIGLSAIQEAKIIKFFETL